MPRFAESALNEDGTSLHILCPVTPSLNDVLSWVRTGNQRLSIHKRQAQQVVWEEVAKVLGYVPASRGEHWAEQVEVSYIRCSNQKRAIDDDNLVGGAKYARDALVSAGLVRDDNPQRMKLATPIEDRPRGKWGELYGPSLHIFVREVK